MTNPGKARLSYLSSHVVFALNVLTTNTNMHMNSLNYATNTECTMCYKECVNNRFQSKRYAALEVQAVPNKGNGLFSTNKLAPNSLIVEYVGTTKSI